MPSSQDHDINLPILVIVRRGRRGGFTVAPADDATNVEFCQGPSDIGESIKEMMDSPSQPRFDPSAMGEPEEEEDPRKRGGRDESIRRSESKRRRANDDDEDDGEDDGRRASVGGGLLDGLMDGVGENGRDPTDQLIMNIGSRLLQAGQNMSTSNRSRRKRNR
jgi:hypothetical protein